MICPACNTGIHLPIRQASDVYDSQPDGLGQIGYDVSHGFCPECGALIVVLREGKYEVMATNGSRVLAGQPSEKIVFPLAKSKKQAPSEVPERLQQDYAEATQVLPISPKASAAISRRILQDILREDYQLPRGSLAAQIDAFIALPGIPSYLTAAVDAVRNVGNFAAHPSKDVQTGQVVDVEPGEAEWLLDVLDALFDFAYVQPKQLDERRHALDAKLKSIGKPPLK